MASAYHDKPWKREAWTSRAGHVINCLTGFTTANRAQGKRFVPRNTNILPTPAALRNPKTRLPLFREGIRYLLRLAVVITPHIPLRYAPRHLLILCFGSPDMVQCDRGSSAQRLLLLPVHIPNDPNPLPGLTRDYAILAPQNL